MDINTAFTYGLVIGCLIGLFILSPFYKVVKEVLNSGMPATDREKEIINNYLSGLEDDQLSILYHHVKYGSSDSSLVNMIGERNYIKLKSGNVGKLLYKYPEMILDRLVNDV